MDAGSITDDTFGFSSFNSRSAVVSPISGTRFKIQFPATTSIDRGEGGVWGGFVA